MNSQKSLIEGSGATRDYMYSTSTHGSLDVVRADPVFEAGIVGMPKEAWKHRGTCATFQDFLDRYIMGARFGGTGRRERSKKDSEIKQRRRNEEKGIFNDEE